LLVERWELKVRIYEKEESEVLGERGKVAVLLGMCPRELQDIVVHKGYRTCVTFIFNYMDNRKSHSGPSPIDIGVVYHRLMYHAEQYEE
jgi:hypothetical protein